MLLLSVTFIAQVEVPTHVICSLLSSFIAYIVDLFQRSLRTWTIVHMLSADQFPIFTAYMEVLAHVMLSVRLNLSSISYVIC